MTFSRYFLIPEAEVMRARWFQLNDRCRCLCGALGQLLLCLLICYAP